MDSIKVAVEGEQLLETLWRKPGAADLRCLECQEPFTDDALVRTFRLEPSGHHDHGSGYSRILSTHKGDILLFDRHLSCLVEREIKFSTVSHVWNPDVSYVQQQRRTLLQTPEVARRFVDISAKIYAGVQQYELGELWLDYLSVPQWSDALKSNILPIMHKLFTIAGTTLIYFDDISPDIVKQLYGKRSQERLRAMTSVCNSKYFKRIWTTMEFIRSKRVRMIISPDCTYLADLDDPAFLNRVHDIWNEEVKHHPFVQQLEAKVQKGKNQVPWSLGPLRLAKALKKINFAMASALLCQRGCRDHMDYLHALKGIVRVSSATPNPMGSDFKTEYTQIAWECLKAGDMTPLLIAPFLEMGDPRWSDDYWCAFAYNDCFTWQLGDETHGPVLDGETRFDDANHIISLPLQAIGIVFVIRDPRNPDILNRFSSAAKLTLEFDGPDLKDFVAAIGRMYGAQPSVMMKNLQARNEVDRLQNVLKQHFNMPVLASALCLSQIQGGQAQSVLAEDCSGSGTMHCFPYDYKAGITCTSCHRTFAHRIAAFGPPTELRHARAYRIPGLRYRRSHGDGMALLVQDGKVVGRMMWATPACACRRTETVRLGLPRFFLPKAHFNNRPD